MFKFNDRTPKKINFNGLNVAKLIFNSVVVWVEKVLKTVTGYPAILENSTGEKLEELKIYGNSIQNGDPTINTPIEVESLGDKVTDESDSNYGKYKIPVTVRGKNLFNYTEARNSTEQGFVDEDGWITISIDNTSGTTTKYSNFWTKVNNNLKPNTKYYVYVDVAKKEGNITLSAVSTHSSYRSQFVDGNVKESGDVTTVSDFSSAKTMLRSFASCKAGEKGSIKFRIAVYEVKQDTFEPYYNEKYDIYLDEPLRKVGDYADYLDLKNRRVVRNVFKYTTNLIESAGEPVDLGTVARMPINLPKVNMISTNHGLSNELKFLANYSEQTEHFYISGSGKQIFIFLLKSRIGDTVNKSALIQYLQNNPITFFGILSEPKIETISVSDVLTTKGTNVITVGTSVSPSNMEVSYYAKEV